MSITLDYAKLGQRIKSQRIKKHMTQEQLAEVIGSATSSISHIERNTHTVSLKMLVDIANALDVSVDQLLCDSLPVINAYLDKDISDLLTDCSVSEKKIIHDIIAVTKKTVREHK